VLVTAFAPYDEWRENASERALEALRADPPGGVELETRVYPVDYAEVERRLADDLAGGFDWALHLGQAPGRCRIELEAVALNLRSEAEAGEGATRPLLGEGPEALRSNAPLAGWVEAWRGDGVPSAVSFHAGTFLCNAALYWSLWHAQRQGLGTRCAFAHLPLTPAQALGRPEAAAHLPSEWVAGALGRLLARLDCDT